MGFLRADLRENTEITRQVDQELARSDLVWLLSAQNQNMRELIVAKAHLIEGATMPDEFVRFFASTLVFDLMLQSRMKERSQSVLQIIPGASTRNSSMITSSTIPSFESSAGGPQRGSRSAACIA